VSCKSRHDFVDKISVLSAKLCRDACFAPKTHFFNYLKGAFFGINDASDVDIKKRAVCTARFAAMLSRLNKGSEVP
jgi:hypothetical protein